MKPIPIALSTGLLFVASLGHTTEFHEVDGNWAMGDHTFAESVSDWEIGKSTAVDGTDLTHLVLAPLNALPDSERRSYLVRGSDSIVGWNSTVDERVRATDLDGDGTAEIVRDLALPAPCGIFVWRQPAVLRDGEFVPVAIGGTAEPARNLGRAGSPPQTAVSEAFDSSDLYLSPPDALSDGDPATAWVLEGTLGAWIAVRAPEGARLGGVRLSSDEGESPLVVNVRFGDGATATLEVDGLHREFAVQTESRCAVITAVDLGGRNRVIFTEASLISSTDELTPSELATTFWFPAVQAACSAGRDANPAAEQLIAADLSAAATSFQQTESLCVASALAHAIASQDPDGMFRLSDEMTLVAAGAAQDSTFRIAASQRLATLSSQDPAWLPALREAVAGRRDVELGAVYASLDEGRFEIALQLAPSAVPVPLSEMLSDESSASWIRSLRTALAFEHPIASAETLRRALAHDNGTVARLGIALAAKSETSELEGELTTIAQRDPSSILRAAAIQALDFMGVTVCGDSHADPAPDVRLATADLGCSADWLREDPTRLQARLTDELWPEVRTAWLQAAARADNSALDGATLAWLIDAGTEEDIAAAFLALRVRGTTVPTEAIDLMIARDDSRRVLQAGLSLLRHADVLPRAWLEALDQAGGYSEQMASTIEALLE